jgi:regulator of sirC expression with transglutaminase-like and TPR domain
MDALRLAIQDQPDARLDLATLDIASIETPDLNPAPSLAILDRLASEIATRLPPAASGQEFVRAANDHLFGDLGFRGNDIDYNDPGNSCLNHVLDRRTGIPITLSVMYIEVARRLKRPVMGVGLPGHFIVQYDDGEYSTYLDPFHSGQVLSAEDCLRIAREHTGAEADRTALEPVGTRYIVVRMLNNLRSSYFRSKQFAKMVKVTDLLIEAFPENADYYKARGVARLRMRHFRAAREDLELYLKLSPDAPDRAQITEQLGAIHRWLGRLN